MSRKGILNFAEVTSAELEGIPASSWPDAVIYCPDYQGAIGNILKSTNLTHGRYWIPIDSDAHPPGNRPTTTRRIVKERLVPINTVYTNNQNSGPWSCFVNGGAAAVSSVTNNGDPCLNFATGTTATGRAGLIGYQNQILFGSGYGNAYFRALISFSGNLSNGTERYTWYSGWGDSLTGVSADAIGFRYVDNESSGNIGAYTRNNSVETLINTGVASVINQEYTLEIFVDTEPRAWFYINGSLVNAGGTATNIPTATGRQTGMEPGKILKSLGTTSRNFNVHNAFYLHGF